MAFSVKCKKVFFVSMIVGGVLVSCDSETFSTGNEVSGGTNSDHLYRMTLYATEGNINDSRASIDEDNIGEAEGSVNTFRWDAGDRIMVWTGSSKDDLTPCLFKTEEGGLSVARFEYEGEPVESRKYFGFYPYSDGIQYDGIPLSVPVDGEIVQEKLGSSLHLGLWRPMFTDVVNRDESSDELSGMRFKHLTSLLCFKLRNMMGDNVMLESITIRCSGSVFSSNATFAFNPDGDSSFRIEDTGKSASSSLSFGEGGNGLSWNYGNITWGFLPVLPVESLDGTTLSVVLKANGREYTSLELSGDQVVAFEQAHYYIFKLTLKDSGLEVESSIEDWRPGENIVIPVE